MSATPQIQSRTRLFARVLGLVVIALHPYWRGPAAAIVSLLGWLTVLKGIALMAFTPTYLTYIGWAPVRSHTGLHQSVGTAADMPRAA